MKLLIVDQDGCGLALAWRAAMAGHMVRWFVRPSKTNDPTVGEGFKRIQKVNNFLPHLKWADLVFATSNDQYIHQLERAKQMGVRYFGPSVKSADLEVRRGLGMQFLEKRGIEVPPYRTFKNLAEAEKFCWKSDYRWVFKTLGDNEDKSLSYCSKSPADMIARLRHWQETGMNPKGEVMLQEFIEGIELGVSRWLGNGGWCSPPNVNWEHKKLMSGNHGPNTGEMGTVMAYEKEEKLSKDVLDPLEKDLLALGHLGDVDLNCIVDKKGKAWPLEFTCRPGWPAFNLMLEQHKGDPIQWMADACDGKETLSVSYDAGVCVVVCIPPFPNKGLPQENKTSGTPIYGITPSNRKHIQPQGVKLRNLPDMEGDKVVEREIWATAGDYIMVITALGKTVKQASERCYKTADEIYIPSMLVRDDIGEGCQKSIPELQKHGYVQGVQHGG
jgi:phosphoribosylamine--glycine ligase